MCPHVIFPKSWAARQAQKARRHLTLLTVAVHLREEGGVAESARIGIDRRRLFEQTARIRDANLIDDGSVPEELREPLAIGAAGYRHDRSIAPAQRFAVMPGERRRICSDQAVERRANLIVLREKKRGAREQQESGDSANLRRRPVTSAARHTTETSRPRRQHQ